MNRFTLLPKKLESIITPISADGSRKEWAFLQMNTENHPENNRDDFFTMHLLIVVLLPHFEQSLTYSLQIWRSLLSGRRQGRE